MEIFSLTENPQILGFSLLALLVLVLALDIKSRVRKRGAIRKPVERIAAEPAVSSVEQPQPKHEPEHEQAPSEASAETVIEPVAAVVQEASPVQAEFEEQKPAPEESDKSESVFARMKKGLSRTHNNLVEGLASLVLGRKAIDEDLLEEIEAQLLMADVGVDATGHIIDSLTEKFKRTELADAEALYQSLKEELHHLLAPCSQPLKLNGQAGPYVLLMVGVNGAGKTTTIGKLAKRFQNDGHSVMLAAGDTFRAAAVEQLEEWGRRNDVPVVAQHTGADSASVIYDALESARAKNIDVLIADTAGRLQNKENLMAELTKVKRVMGKLDQAAPHEVMLVLDAGTGQNALSQAKLFDEAVGVTGITMTKLDGTAKGGVIFAVAKQMNLPIRFIGVGEKIDDLRPFDADQFVSALFD